jgi:fluoroquinolone transport system permease protein
VALTPTGRSGFLVRRLAVPVLWCVPIAFAVTWLAALPLGDPLRFAAIAVLAGIETPLLALFMTAFGSNKVEGMAMAKMGNVLLTGGAIALLLQPPWHWSGAPAPGWWLIRLLFARESTVSDFVVLLAGATVVHLLALLVLLEMFRRRTT